jgi:hypothetical protein
MKRELVIFGGIVISMFFMGGCATVISGKTQTITVTAKKKTSFTIEGARYTTPAKILVRRSKKDKIIHVNGCKNIVLKAGVNPVAYGNIVAGGVIGSSVDSGGAGWKYQDTVVLCK